MNTQETTAISLLMKNVINTSTSTEQENLSTSETDWNNSSHSTSNTSSSSEENDDIFFPLMKYLISGRKRHRVEHYLHVVDNWTDLEFKEHLRINRIIAIRLIDELHDSGYIPSHSFGVKPIEAKLCFLVFLWHLANTEPLRTISDRFDISISSVFRVICRVTAWILTKLDDVIKWPEGQYAAYVCQEFYAKRGIPNVIGTIDCTHIKIEKPNVENARDYCNRKRYFSVNLQAVVDSNMKFTNIYCGQPGSLHDARVLRKSPLYNSANEDREVIFPNGKFIIGDSAYPLQWLVPPFRDNGHLTPLETEFNFIHSSTRMIVERAFGYLKGRFRRIKFFSEYRDLPFVTNTIVTACILHNLCLDYNDENFNYDNVEIEELDNINMNDDLDENINCELQVDRRMQIFREIFDQE
ncbi:PREDICTED: putative nuclease HARBI1 [Trachymyrmex cornetzi]|uniref:putative nuclease HARBI1 n=1 Tax=Trachymyrmex cornetzi TaxID=471704 RepID=UPI00084ED2C5|nr:PREDICTED: putative nuclease HARBI1 [Trachymyrmex cornetzi]